VTASPDIQYRKFELPSSSPSVSRRTLRFIILATDGLWDEISNAQAVALVGGHLAGYRGTIPALQITKQIPTEDTTTASKLATPPAATNTNILSSSNGSSLAYLNATAMPHLMPHSAQKVRNIDWAFRDESIVMHLIRNAIGGTDDIKIRQSLSIPSPYTRRHRDDITVAVITFDGPDSHTVNAKVKAKAKL
jgi:pyruvate dehydrogenase phosphatase